MDDGVSYDASTALVVVDVQNDFADPAGSLYVAGGEQVVPLVNREVARALGSGAFVVYTQDWHPAETPHFARFGGRWPVHCVGGTWGAAFPPGLSVQGPSIQKAQGPEDGYSGFTVESLPTGSRAPTGLEDMLRARGITKIVVVGLATDYCVRETGLDGLHLGFDVTIVRDLVRAVDVEPGDGDRALTSLTAAGAHVA